MLDATRGLEDQDKKIINMVDYARKGMIIAVNKWDLVEKETNTADDFTKDFYDDMRLYDYVPLVFISAVTKQRITKVIELAKDIKQRRTQRISTGKLNKEFLPELDRTPPPSIQGKDLRIN
jgi:GTP-binding protein